MTRTHKHLSIAFLIVLSALLIVSVGSASAKSSSAKASSVVITTKKVGKLGTILVNSKGLTLYMFVPDKQKKVTCVSSCAVVWPPVKLASGAKAVAKGGVKASLLGSDTNPSGGKVVTYHGWPLYTYVSDTKPGTANGQALDINGGYWYVLSPSGSVIKTKT